MARSLCPTLNARRERSPDSFQNTLSMTSTQNIFDVPVGTPSYVVFSDIIGEHLAASSGHWALIPLPHSRLLVGSLVQPERPLLDQPLTQVSLLSKADRLGNSE